MGGKCVFDFTAMFDSFFGAGGATPHIADHNFLPQACAKFDKKMTIKTAVSRLIRYADEQLGSENHPCVDYNGRYFRAEYRCVPEFKYKNKIYKECATDPLPDFDHIRAPWCSWETEVPNDIGWDNAWSYCTRCEPPTD